MKGVFQRSKENIPLIHSGALIEPPKVILIILECFLLSIKMITERCHWRPRPSLRSSDIKGSGKRKIRGFGLLMLLSRLQSIDLTN